MDIDATPNGPDPVPGGPAAILPSISGAVGGARIAAEQIAPGTSRTRGTGDGGRRRPSRAGKQPLLEGPHLSFLGRFGMVPATQMERAVGHEQPELVGRRPPDVAGLPAASGRRLVHRALDGDDDVAEV